MAEEADLVQAIEAAQTADIVIIGEFHDNPDHHRIQAALVDAIAPSAIVFEMLSDDQAARITPEISRDAETLGPLLDWDDSGWPDIAFYAPIMAAAPQAAIVGTGPRDWTQTPSGVLMTALPEDAGHFGYGDPLPADQQQAREALQAEAHCDMLPPEQLPMMVDIQRQRDVVFAAATLDALLRHGSPVVLITGNGHARTDWGVPAALAKASPNTAVLSIGQTEGDAALSGTFDLFIDAPAPVRGDPCDAFR
ncbi:ChaN family lipoprotein [Aestuariibius insulae]|uniref:ChaN family lipoprotein n=1 Tax=Aestuariibius insulae TaxID=2058287 RepID=UPI00345E48C1